MNQKYYRPEPTNQKALAIATPGYTLIFALAFITLIFALLEMTFITLVFLFATFFTVYFFRDPERGVPVGEKIAVSPADGEVVEVSVVRENPFIDGVCLKIGIFMSVFNVHVNRIPMEGVVSEVIYHPGDFMVARKTEASRENELNALIIGTKEGVTICVVQVAGLIARRIVCNVQPGEPVTRGQRYGMICFGSRLDVYLPADAKAAVSAGDRVKSGESILGELS